MVDSERAMLSSASEICSASFSAPGCGSKGRLVPDALPTRACFIWRLLGERVATQATRQDALCLRARLQAALLQAPQKHIQTVLSEERFAFENHRRHAPMARIGMRLLVCLDDGFVFLWIG